MSKFKILLTLLAATALQVIILEKTLLFPDLIFLTVIFAGIFMGMQAGAYAGLIGGLLRGSVSPGLFVFDIIAMTISGISACLFSKLFYRHNPVVQLSITVICVVIFAAAGSVCLRMIEGHSSTMLLSPVFWTWQHLLVTIIAAPFYFVFLKTTFYRTEGV